MIHNLAAQKPEQVLITPMPGYYWKLLVAQSWLWSGDAQPLRDAITLLTQLRRDYPHAMQIGTELALVLIHDDQLSAAENLLHELAADWGAPDEELLCRWGRLYKDSGDKLWAAHRDHPDYFPRICAVYERSLTHYEEAYAIRHGHYPGINVATLRLLIASLRTLPAQRDEDRQRSRQIAHDLLQRRAHWPSNHDDDSLWHLATEGEAYLLLEQWDAAEQAYHRAFANAHCLPGRRVLIELQLQRVIQAYERTGTDVSETLRMLVKGRDDSKDVAGWGVRGWGSVCHGAMSLTGHGSRCHAEKYSYKHAALATRRAKTLFTGCGFKTWNDINADGIERHLAKLRTGDEKLSRQTTNFYLQAAKQFAKWMVRSQTQVDRRSMPNLEQHLQQPLLALLVSPRRRPGTTSNPCATWSADVHPCH